MFQCKWCKKFFDHPITDDGVHEDNCVRMTTLAAFESCVIKTLKIYGSYEEIYLQEACRREVKGYSSREFKKAVDKLVKTGVIAVNDVCVYKLK